MIRNRVNWEHLQAFLWLRWRLTANQWRRSGAINGLLMMVVAIFALAMSLPLLVGCFLLGWFLFPDATAADLLYVWDGVIVVFLFFWSIGLVSDLQRTEALSLSNFLHLPVSLPAAFAINYVSSLVRLSLIVFLPVMLGLAGGLIFAKGVRLAPVLPLLAAFLLMVTAVTYQFQGWLASLMTNPRRRRNIIVAATALFVLVFQLPNLLNAYSPWQKRAEQSQAMVKELDELQAQFEAQQIDAQEHLRRQNELIARHQAASQEADRVGANHLLQTARFVNLVLPLGWLPLGVMLAAEGRFVLSLAGLVGMTLLGAASLVRAYATTVRLYRGNFTAGKRVAKLKAAAPKATSQRSSRLMDAKLPGLSEPVSAVALAGLQSLIRAPEAKMMLLTPLVMAAIFGFMSLRRLSDVPQVARPWIALGAMVLVLIGLLQLGANQFGFDRDGFRAFVLCAAPRRDILFGKNLALAPAAFGLAAVLVTILQVVSPLSIDQLLSMPLLFLSMFLPFCALANLLSIVAPMPIAAGSMKPAMVKLGPVFLQLALFSGLFPLTVAPALLPLIAETALDWFGWWPRVPSGLLLSILVCGAVVLLYQVALNWQGKLLHAREQKILETITNQGH